MTTWATYVNAITTGTPATVLQYLSIIPVNPETWDLYNFVKINFIASDMGVFPAILTYDFDSIYSKYEKIDRYLIHRRGLDESEYSNYVDFFDHLIMIQEWFLLEDRDSNIEILFKEGVDFEQILDLIAEDLSD